MEQLYEFFNRKLKRVPLSFVRYKYEEIKWQGRAFALVGPRGVGKSTMLLQHIKQHLDLQQTLYVSADHLFFSEHSLVELADRFVKMGGKHLFIDEIHNMPVGLANSSRSTIVMTSCNWLFPGRPSWTSTKEWPI